MNELIIWTAGKEPVCAGCLPDFDKNGVTEYGLWRLFEDCVNFVYIILKTDEPATRKRQVFLSMGKTKYIQESDRRTPLQTDINSSSSVLSPLSEQVGYYISSDPFLLCDPFGTGYSLYAECKEALSPIIKCFATHKIELCPSGSNFTVNYMCDFKSSEKGLYSFKIKVENSKGISFSFLLSRCDENEKVVKKNFPPQTVNETELTINDVTLSEGLQCKCLVAASYANIHDADKLVVTFLNLKLYG